MTVAKIQVQFLGNFSLQWSPSVVDTSIKTYPPNPDPRFATFVEKKLQEAKIMPPAERADRIKWTHIILDCAQDPACHTMPPGSDRWTDKEHSRFSETLFRGLVDILRSGTGPWDRGDTMSKDCPGSSRDPADRKAQREVSQLYDHRCILTGTARADAAHIVPVRAKHADHDTTWQLLQTFWPVEKPTEVLVKGKEHLNILPLTPTAHAMFDAFFFALRPISHPDLPNTRLFLQVVWLRDPDGQRINDDWNHRRFGGLFDFRRNIGYVSHDGETCPKLRQGDVYELSTADPVLYPLPSEHLLQMQYGLHKIMSGIRAAGVLRSIFEDPPNDDDDQDSGDSMIVPPDWAALLEEAQALGILDDNAALGWGRAFSRKAREEAEERDAKEKAFLLGRETDDDVESLSDRDEKDKSKEPGGGGGSHEL